MNVSVAFPPPASSFDAAGHFIPGTWPANSFCQITISRNDGTVLYSVVQPAIGTVLCQAAASIAIPMRTQDALAFNAVVSTAATTVSRLQLGMTGGHNPYTVLAISKSLSERQNFMNGILFKLRNFCHPGMFSTFASLGALISSCGGTYQLDATSTTVQASTKTVSVTANRPDVFSGPPYWYRDIVVVPRYETPCDSTGRDCQNDHRTTLCLALEPICANFGQPELTRAQANNLTENFTRCFPNYASTQQVASTMASPARHLCPEYVLLGRLDANNNLVRSTNLPTTVNAPCSSFDVDVFPIAFCTTSRP